MIDIELASDGNVLKKNEKANSSGYMDFTELLDKDNDRYSRLRLIPWWNQERMASAKIMVVGAGALGNEILKNLALLGIGNIYVVDFDTIENSNLSRSVLFRAENEGMSKAQIAANAIKELNPDCHVEWINGNIICDIGLGLFRRMDVVIGGLDNREARLAINQACWRVGVPWVDGAIEVLFGVARVFIPPDTACYECTMTEQDYKLLNLRKSCALLSREDMLTGKIPTTPTTSAVIAGIQVQEAVKLIHAREDLPVLAGQGFYFNGLTHDSYVINYDRKEGCFSHESFERIIEMDRFTDNTTAGELLELAKSYQGTDAVIDLHKDIVIELKCENCQTTEKIFKALSSIYEKDGRCSRCNELRTPVMTHTIEGHEDFLDLTLDKLGIPAFDIVTARRGLEMLHLEFTGDLNKIIRENKPDYEYDPQGGSPKIKP